MHRVIDLTVAVASGDRGVRIEQARRLEVDGWNATTQSSRPAGLKWTAGTPLP